MLVRTPLVCPSNRHNSNRLKLNASVDEEWRLLVCVVKKDTGSHQPPLHPGSRCQQDPGWLPRPALCWVLQGWCRHQQVSPGAGRWRQCLSAPPAAPPAETGPLPHQLKSQNRGSLAHRGRVPSLEPGTVAERGVPCTARTDVRRAWPLWQGRGNPLLRFICPLTCRPHANSDCSVHAF